MPRWSRKAGDKLALGRGWLRKLMPPGIWHFHYKNHRDRWKTKSTGHRDKQGAIRWAEQFLIRLNDDEFGSPKTQKLPDTTVDRAIDDWLAYQQPKCKRTTYRTYRSIAKKFKEFCAADAGRRYMTDITDDTLLEFRTWALAKKNTKVTIDNNLVAIRRFFSWAKASGLVKTNPASQQRHGKQVFFGARSEKKDTYTKNEYALLTEYAPKGLKVVIRLLANLGLRISELSMLEWTNVNLDDGWVHIRIKRTHDGIDYSPKDNTDRKIPINVEVDAILRALAAENGRQGFVLPLPSTKSRADYAERTFLGELKKLKDKTNIQSKRLILHSFRRFFISECADQGVPMATVIEWVGHDEMKMVMRYYSLRDEAAKEAMKRFQAGGRRSNGEPT